MDALAIGPGLLVIAGLWLLRGFLRSVLAGDPFGARNVQRLRSLGLLLAAGRWRRPERHQRGHDQQHGPAAAWPKPV